MSRPLPFGVVAGSTGAVESPESDEATRDTERSSWPTALPLALPRLLRPRHPRPTRRLMSVRAWCALSYLSITSESVPWRIAYERRGPGRTGNVVPEASLRRVTWRPARRTVRDGCWVVGEGAALGPACLCSSARLPRRHTENDGLSARYEPRQARCHGGVLDELGIAAASIAGAPTAALVRGLRPNSSRRVARLVILCAAHPRTPATGAGRSALGRGASVSQVVRRAWPSACPRPHDPIAARRSLRSASSPARSRWASPAGRRRASPSRNT